MLTMSMAGFASMSRFRRPETILLLAVAGLAGCNEFVEFMVEDLELSYCPTCDWIIQEWDDPGWSTHNSDPYETEQECEEELQRQSRESKARGHRCIHESELPHERDALIQPNDFCYGCDWAVQVQDYSRWERTEDKTHKTEGRCMQALWHQYKKEPENYYRCVNLDTF